MQTTEFTIRRAEARDAADLAVVLRGQESFAYFKGLAPEEGIEHVGRHLALCRADGSHAVWVAEDATGHVVGYVALHVLPYLFMAGPEAYVSELFVHPDATGKGIGSALLEQAIAEAKARGCYRLALINFRQRESYLRSFYAKRGWEERPDGANFVYYIPRE